MAKLVYYGPHDYTEEQVINKLSGRPPAVLAIDTETVSLEDRRLIGIGIALSRDEAVYFPVRPVPSPYLGLAWHLLSGDSLKLFFNAMYDLYAMKEYVTSEAPSGPCNIGDHKHTLVRDAGAMGQIQGLPQASLQDNARRYLGWHIEAISDILPKGCDMLDLPLWDVAWKCIMDTLTTRHLYDAMGGERWWASDSHTWGYTTNPALFNDYAEPRSYTVTQAMKDCYRVDMKLIPLLMRMSHRGMKMRRNVVEELYQSNRRLMMSYEDICTDHGFEPRKRQQVGLVLADRGSFLPFTKGGRQLKTDKKVLKGLSDPLAQVLLLWSQYNTLDKMYLRKWHERMQVGNLRAHTHFRMDLSTMRLASYEDNLQNIPGGLRKAFSPDADVWSSADASQIEYRCFAWECQDPVMLEAYRQGSDIHAATQEACWPEAPVNSKEARRLAKVFNFALVYGYHKGVARTLSTNTGLPVSKCQELVDVWKDKYQVAAAYLQAHVDDGLPPWVETLYGRRCRLPQVGERGTTLHHAINCLHSYGPQAGAQEIVKRAMLMVGDLDQRLQVHDEILVNGRVEFPLAEMAQICPEVPTPFNVEIGASWGETDDLVEVDIDDA